MKAKHVLVFLLVIAAAVNAATVIKLSITTDDYKSLTNDIFSISQVRDFMGQQATILFRVGSSSTYVTIQGGAVTGTSATGIPDFTITASYDAALSIFNSQDKANTIRALLADRSITISAPDPGKQAAINAALSSGLLKPSPVSTPNDGMVYNRFGAPIGFAGNQKLKPPANSGIFFNKPPGVLAQFPGLIYDTVSSSPNAVGPWNIFKINPGLVGPNQILAQNPGLIGPADIALLNPNLHGPAEFAYVMGIGAHSNSARLLQSRGLVNSASLGPSNRWGNTR